MPDGTSQDALIAALRRAGTFATIAGNSAKTMAGMEVAPLVRALRSGRRGFETALFGDGRNMAEAGAGALGKAVQDWSDDRPVTIGDDYQRAKEEADAKTAALRKADWKSYDLGEKLPEIMMNASMVKGGIESGPPTWLQNLMPRAPQMAPAYALAGRPAAAISAAAVPRPIARAGEAVEFKQSTPTVEEIQKLMDDGGFDHYGVRVAKEGDIGDVLDPSRKWDDGAPTNELLPGTSTIGIRQAQSQELTARSIAKALKEIQAYFGKKLMLVGSNGHAGSGADQGEDLLIDPTVLGSWRKD